MMMRRNWVLRCSIIANLAVLFYLCIHVVVKNGPVEYTFEPGAAAKSLASAGDTLPPPQPQQDQMRTFILDKSNDINPNELAQLDKINSTSSVNPNNANSSIVSLVSEFLEEEDAPTTAAGAPADDTVLNERTLEWLRITLECKDRSFEPVTRQRGEFWVLHNFVRADHGPLGCHETVTYTTHGDFTFMDNLVPLLEKYVVLICFILTIKILQCNCIKGPLFHRSFQMKWLIP